jgi:hypothetical protein
MSWPTIALQERSNCKGDPTGQRRAAMLPHHEVFPSAIEHQVMKRPWSEVKTLFTHGRTARATFLGYELTVPHSEHRRTVNGNIGLRVPPSVVQEESAAYMK